MIDDADLAVLGQIFESIGAQQRAVSEDHADISVVEPELLRLCTAAVDLLGEGNDHIWGDFHKWLIFEWAAIYRREGNAAADAWLAFCGRVRPIIPPPEDDLRLDD